MPSTYSPDLRIELIANGEQSGTWGGTTNNNLGTLIEDAISGLASVSVTTANQALTALNGAADQARCAAISLTTTTTANFNVYVPPATKLYVVVNASAYTATIFCSTVLGNTTAAGTGVAVPAGKSVLLRSTGVNVVEQLNHVVGNLSVGGTLTVTGAATLGDGSITTTQTSTDNSTKLATTAFVKTAVGAALQDPGSNGILVRTAASTTTARSVAAGTGISVSNGDGVSGNPTITNTGVTSVNGATGAVSVFSSTVVAITSVGTSSWTVPAGVTRCKVTVTGGGQGGYTSVTPSGTGAQGGGAGGTAIRLVTGLTPGGTVSVTVGGGGSGGAGVGGTSLFGAFCSATGGSSAVGGAGSSGDLNLFGGGGGVGSLGNVSANGNGGMGGGSFWGGGGGGGGGAGQAYGAGGGGSNNNGSAGAGAAGVVVIEY